MGLKIVTAKRAAIYARFSTDLQSDRSVEDQVALCEAYAARQGFVVVARFHDRARSGSSMFGRDGLAKLVEQASASAFEVVIAEAADRISRDMADLAGLHKRLDFAGISIDCVNGGRLDTLQIGVHGLVGQMQREEGARKVKRGMAGVARDGRHAGGRAFGYRPIAGRPGEMEIHGAEAAVVRRIFEAYRAGATPRDIARSLNADGVPPPRGETWNASTINGNKTRGHGILLNDVYAGRLVWNRVRMVKDPATGRRVSRANPESEWIVTDAPHLAIVDAELFAAVRQRKLGRSHVVPARRQNPKRLLSGLLRCGACGGGMHVHDRDHGRIRIACARVKESRSCDHGRRYFLEDVERLVVHGLRDELTHPSLIADYARAYHEEMQALTARVKRDRGAVERKLAEAERGIARLLDMVVSGALSDPATVKLRMDDLTAERDRCRQDLAAADDDAAPISLHPAALETYGRDLDALAKGLGEAFADGDAAAVAAFRSLVDHVVVEPSKAGERVSVTVQGRLALLLDHDLFPSVAVSGGSVVAEEGLEPPTRGL